MSHHNLVTIFDSINQCDSVTIKQIIKSNNNIIQEVIKKCRNTFKLPTYFGQIKDDKVKQIVIKLTTNDNSKFEAILTTGDGNCLYSAVSNALFGNESYSFKLRLASLLIIIKYEQFFDNLYREAQADTFENLIKKVATNKSWGNDLIMIALSIVIKRPIFYYNTLGNTAKTTQTLNKIAYANKSQLLTAPINLVLNEQHFTALVSHDSDYQFKSSSAPENQYEKFELQFE